MKKKKQLEIVKSQFFQYPQTKYLPVKKSNLDSLSANQIKHIDEVLDRLGNKNATELKDYSHEDVPWITTEQNQPIDYETVFYRTPKTSVRNYNE